MKFAVLVFPGSSCDLDMYHAIKDVVGEEVHYVWHAEADLTSYDAVLIPTGAAYGNYVRPGALAKSSPAVEQLRTFAETGKLVLGVGNGFHILVEVGLLPGAFLRNKGLKFRSGNAQVTVTNTTTAFTSAYAEKQVLTLPFAHEYGNYYVPEETLAQLQNANQIVFTYTNDDHDGSVARIAGVINEQGNVLGMMPLPERAVEEIIGGTDGLPLFNSILKNWSENNVSQA